MVPNFNTGLSVLRCHVFTVKLNKTKHRTLAHHGVGVQIGSDHIKSNLHSILFLKLLITLPFGYLPSVLQAQSDFTAPVNVHVHQQPQLELQAELNENAHALFSITPNREDALTKTAQSIIDPLMRFKNEHNTPTVHHTVQ